MFHSDSYTEADRFLEQSSLFLSMFTNMHKTISRPAKRNPCATPDIQHLIKAKRCAFRQYKKDPTPEKKEIFTVLWNKVTHLLRMRNCPRLSTLHRAPYDCFRQPTHHATSGLTWLHPREWRAPMSTASWYNWALHRESRKFAAGKS